MAATAVTEGSRPDPTAANVRSYSAYLVNRHAAVMQAMRILGEVGAWIAEWLQLGFFARVDFGSRPSGV